MTYGIIDAPLLNSQLQQVLSSGKLYVPPVRLAAEIMYLTGCRAVESITPDMWERLSFKSYILHPQKGNNDRVITNTAIPDLFDGILQSGSNFFNNINYDKLKYHMNLALINRQYRVGNKDTVCHIFRHNYAKQLALQGYTDEDIQHDLGEVNLESAQGYINSEIFGYY